MSYNQIMDIERYLDIIRNGYNMEDEFEWLVQAVLSDPTHARDMLIDAIKEVTE